MTHYARAGANPDNDDDHDDDDEDTDSPLAIYIVRRKALTRHCPRCGKPPDEKCVNTITGQYLRAPAHWQRLQPTPNERAENDNPN